MVRKEVDMSIKIIFAGTSVFAIPSLAALLRSSYEVCAVYTTPDKPAGRGQKLTSSPIKEFASQYGLAIYQPETLNSKDEQNFINTLKADLMIDVAYGLLLPKEVLNAFKYGCINVHPSLLPRWRGAAPIQRTILAGDAETGVTIMQVGEGWDTGDILKQEKIIVDNFDTGATLQTKLSELGNKLLLETINEIKSGTSKPIPQDNNLSCYAKKITKEEGKINWQLSASEIDRMIRAFNPWPVAFSSLNNISIRIWQAVPIPKKTNALPGTIIAINKNIDVATGDGILRLLATQLPGGKVLTVEQILNSRKLFFNVGNRFDG